MRSRKELADAIRILSMDAVDKAKSGRNAHAFARKEIKSLLTNNDILLLYDGKLEVIL